MTKQPPLSVVMVGTGAANLRTLVPDAPPAEVKDRITATPDITGARGCAWQCNINDGRRQLGVSAENDATLVHWVIEARWAHPCWHSYSLVLVHLRPLPDE